MHSADYAVARYLTDCLSVCLSVCLSHSGVLLKRLNIIILKLSSLSDNHTILVFLTKRYYSIFRGGGITGGDECRMYETIRI